MTAAVAMAGGRNCIADIDTCSSAARSLRVHRRSERQRSIVVLSPGNRLRSRAAGSHLALRRMQQAAWLRSEPEHLAGAPGRRVVVPEQHLLPLVLARQSAQQPFPSNEWLRARKR